MKINYVVIHYFISIVIIGSNLRVVISRIVECQWMDDDRLVADGNFRRLQCETRIETMQNDMWRFQPQL